MGMGWPRNKIQLSERKVVKAKRRQLVMESTDISGILGEGEQTKAFSPEAANRETELKITPITANSTVEKMKLFMHTQKTPTGSNQSVVASEGTLMYPIVTTIQNTGVKGNSSSNQNTCVATTPISRNQTTVAGEGTSKHFIAAAIQNTGAKWGIPSNQVDGGVVNNQRNVTEGNNKQIEPPIDGETS
ncbi:hypothetical protein A4A49_33520 [Nicotiana attenuata]|uniref:Uncharacterized protein n=1 Tax=Nicotiana attenuata TaxID=49451 RepID=A0A314LEV8_NICAT|nr:hypothetical protein A4A49_33520 [Nicotiana attenuata]